MVMHDISNIMPQPSLAEIMRLQAIMLALPQAETGLQHHFAPGVYLRELMIPAGVTIVGKMHGTEHLLIVACGEVSIVNSEGTQHIVGPRVLRTMTGTKRAIHALSDATLMTVHVTNETDLAQIEAAIILPDPVDLIEGAVA